LKDFLLNQSLAVRTNILPEVQAHISNITPTYDSVIHYKTNIIEWLKPIVDLTNFNVYPMNGITEGLNWWSGTSKYNIWREPGEYQWVNNINGRMHPTIVYQSIPSAIDGNFKTVKTDSPVALDLAYVGSTGIQKITLPDNVQYVFYSLSKSFGISNIRTGWFFCRTPDEKQEALIHSAKYYNYFAHQVAESIISTFDIDFVYKSLYNKQKKVCKEMNFIPSDSVWLATTKDSDYSKFRRKDDIARICLAGVYKC
jgi:hypothetical protein